MSKPCVDHGFFRYIKELASRVDALEGQGRPIPPPGYQYTYDSEYSPQADLGYGSSKKRTHSMSEGIQHPVYMQEGQEPTGEGSLGRYPPTSTADWSGRDQAQNLLHADPNDVNTDRNDPLSSFVLHDANKAPENLVTLPTPDYLTNHQGQAVAHSDMETTTMTNRVPPRDEDAIST